jgi:hypothetical protein
MGSEKPKKAPLGETPFSIDSRTGLSLGEVEKKLERIISGSAHSQRYSFCDRG